MRTLARIVSALVLCTASLESQSTKSAPKPPPGTKVVSGRHFDVYVAKVSEKPMGVDGYTLKIWSVIAVAQTRTHGKQRVGGRVETINSDLLDPKSWEILDLDGDGFDDYRFLAETAKNGCGTWSAELWQPDRDHFTSAPQFARHSDAQNKTVKANCAGM
ncbi:MAG: hypothetical protein ACHQQ3_06530 [Gemmatimonadales bacterium]